MWHMTDSNYLLYYLYFIQPRPIEVLHAIVLHTLYTILICEENRIRTCNWLPLLQTLSLCYGIEPHSRTAFQIIASTIPPFPLFIKNNRRAETLLFFRLFVDFDYIISSSSEKSSSAEEPPESLSPSSNFCRLFNPAAIPLLPLTLKA